MGAYKNSSPKRGPGLYPNSQPRIPTRVCQGHVVTADLPTLGTNSKRSQSGSTIQEAKDLAVLQQPWRTVRDPGADGPLPTGGRSVNRNRTTRRAPNRADGPYLVLGRSASNSCRADGPRPLGGWSGPQADGPRPLRRRSDKPLPARTRRPNESKRRHSRTRDELEEPLDNRLCADYPQPIGRLSARPEQSSSSSKPQARPLLPVHGSPKRLELLRKDLGKM
jgi:hypothetical protein